MNTVIKLNIRSELKLQHQVSTLHLTSSLSFHVASLCPYFSIAPSIFSYGLFLPFSFYLLPLITRDLFLLISPSLSLVVSLLSLNMIFFLLFRLSVPCFDSLPLSLSVSSPLADERAECFLLLPSRWRWKSDLFVDAVTVATSHLFARLQPLTSNS